MCIRDRITAASALALSLGIAIQNFPEGAIISLPLRAEGESKGKAFLGGVLSGVVEPVGAVLTIIAAQLIIPALDVYKRQKIQLDHWLVYFYNSTSFGLYYCKEHRERKKDSSCLYCTKYSKADQCTIRSVSVSYTHLDVYKRQILNRRMQSKSGIQRFM